MSEDCTPGSPHGAQKPFPENEAGSSCQSTAEDELHCRLRGSPASEKASSTARNPGRWMPPPSWHASRRRRRSTVNYAPFDMPVSLDDVPRAARDRHSPVCSADLSPSIRGLPLSSPAQKGSLVSATRSGPSSAPKVFPVASAEFGGPCEPRGEHRSFLRPPRLVLPRAGSPVRCCGPRGRLVPRLLG